MAKCSCHSDDEVKEETSPCSCGEGDICNCEDACSCAEDNLDCQCHEHEHSHAAKKSCGCGCDDDDEEEEEDVKETLKLIAFSALWLILAIAVTKLLDLPVFAQLLVFLPAYFSSGADVLKSAGKALLKGRPFNENFLMSVATVGALAIAFVPGGSPEFAEAIFVMLFYKVGELFEDIAHDRSRRSIESLMDIRPDSAVVLRDGEHVALDAKEISVGEIIYVSAGERIALDGTIVEGTSALDTSALTGESAPVDCVPGDSVLSGSVNLSGTLTVKTTSTFQNSTASRILSLVESAEANKSKSERMISKFARYYTPAVVFAALALAILGPIFEGDFASWLLRALTFLIVSCPCALVVSVPLSFFGGIGAASKQGILIKGANYLEALAKADTAAFDKTGTLTEGRFEVKLVHTEAISQDELLHLAAHVEALSKHPIAVALREAFPDAASANDNCEVTDIQEIAGKGITASVNGHKVSVGNAAFMEEVSEGATDCCKDVDLNIVHVAQDGKYLGHIVCEDVIKQNAKEAISKLKDAGITHTIMLSGDRASVAQKVATQLGISEAMAELLPQQKVACFEQIMEKHQNTTSSCIYVGDGINDAPVLARADVGIAMGGVGSDVAIEAADVVLMDDNLAKVAKAIQISKRTLQIAWQNLGIALGVKLLILVLAALGLAPMWLAVFGDTGVLMLCVANASRTLKVPK